VDVEGAVRVLAGPEHAKDVDKAVRAIEPLRAFLSKNSSETDRKSFADTSVKLGRATSGNEVWVLAPAFVATELREAFAIAVLIFIPFLVIDLVVGLGLASLGLQATSPQTVALPLKLLLFVAVDGWRLLLDSLLRGYA
jgi:type III secretion protein R